MRRVLAWVGAAAIVALGVLLWLPTLHRTMDDAWISFRYAANLADGLGLVWDAGPPAVEGYSNLAWTLLVALGLAVGAPLLPWVWGWALALSVATVLAAAGGVRAAGGGRLAALGAALLVATSAALRPWLLTGLETPLLAFLLTAGTWRLLVETRGAGRIRAPLSALLFGLAAVTRPEGALYLLVPAVGWALAARRGWRPGVGTTVGAVALGLGPLAAQVVVRLGTYGAWVANTGVAKLSFEDAARLDGWRYLLAALAYDPLQAGLLVVGCAAALRHRVALPLVALLPAAGFVLLANGDSFSELRLLAPVVPCVAVGVAAGLDAAVRARAGGARAALGVLAGLAVVGVAAREAWVIRVERVSGAQGPGLAGGPGSEQGPGPAGSTAADRLAPPWATVRTRAEGGPAQRDLLRLPSPPRAELDWFTRLLVERLPEGATFVFEDIGLVGWLLRDARLLDARGLTWPEAARVVNLALGPDPGALPEVRAFREAFLREDPALVFLTCPVEGFRTRMEEVLLADPRFAARWRLAARGPYFSGRGQVCLYERDGFVPAGPGVGEARYRRLEAEVPTLYDWAGLRAGLGSDPARAWRVDADGKLIEAASDARGEGRGEGRGERRRQGRGTLGNPAGGGAGEEERRRRRRARGLAE